MTTATTTLAQPTVTTQAQQRECPHCNGRGYVVTDFKERDGYIYSITQNCRCTWTRREETRNG
jgi:DnaJ-class molecular chaperone